MQQRVRNCVSSVYGIVVLKTKEMFFLVNTIFIIDSNCMHEHQQCTTLV